MIIEKEITDEFLNQASSIHGLSLIPVIVDATSHPSLFAFSEILSVNNVIQLQGTKYSVYFDLLRIFAYGTWIEYKSNASNLPPLVPEQILKLKQLTLLRLAETNKVLPYDLLTQELDVVNVCDLEDLLTGIVRGKPEQFRICFQVQFASGRDQSPGQLESTIHTLSNWSSTSDNLPTELIYLRFPSLSSEHPWLVLQNPKDAEEVSSDDQMFYAMGPIIKNNLPKFHCRLHQLRNRHIQGFFHGWVVSCIPSRTIWYLWNMATSTHILLYPPYLEDSSDAVDPCFKHYCLTSTPDEPGSVFVLARSDRPTFLVCQIDNHKWTEVSYREEIDKITLDFGMLHNLTWFNGKIFAVCSDTLLGTTMLLVEITSKKGEPTIMLSHYVYGPTESPSKEEFGRRSRFEQFLKGTRNGLYYIELVQDIMHMISYACLYKLEIGTMSWEPILNLKDAIFYVDLCRAASVFYSVVTDSESCGYVHIGKPSSECMGLYDVKKHTVSLWRGPHTQKTNVYSLWECSSPPPPTTPTEEMFSPPFSYQRRSIHLCEGCILGLGETRIERLDKSYKIRGFFYEWAVLSSDENVQWSIWNPKTLNVINLPTLDIDVLDCEAIKQCCLSSSPRDPSSVLLLMRTDKPVFLLCPLHTREWTEISYAAQLDILTPMLHDITTHILDSITYYDGKLYVLNSFVPPLLIEVKTEVIQGEVGLQLLVCGRCPVRSHSNDWRYYLKGYDEHLFCIIVLFENERKNTVKAERPKNLIRERNLRTYDSDEESDMNLALALRWEKCEDFRGTFLVDLSRDYTVYYKPETGAS